MKAIKRGNDFVVNWQITKGGFPLVMEGAAGERLMLSNFGITREIPFTREGSTLMVEITPEMAPRVGHYSLFYDFSLPDASFKDGRRNRSAGCIAFRIVSTSSQSDEVNTIDIQTEI